MENRESHEIFKNFMLQAWKVMEFTCRSWKMMENFKKFYLVD